MSVGYLLLMGRIIFSKPRQTTMPVVLPCSRQQEPSSLARRQRLSLPFQLHPGLVIRTIWHIHQAGHPVVRRRVWLLICFPWLWGLKQGDQSSVRLLFVVCLVSSLLLAWLAALA